MKINKILSQYRRDFTAVYECSFCGHTKKGTGYDDAYFHRNVIPKMICDKCGKSEFGGGADYRPLTPKYPEWMQI